MPASVDPSLTPITRAGLSRRVQADLALLAVAGIWGATFVMVKDALDVVGPFTFLAVRFGLATLLLAGLLLSARRRRALNRGVAQAGVRLGVLLCGGYAFQTAGLHLSSAARTAFVTGLTVILVPLLAAVALRRRVGSGVWGGVALATIGLTLLTLGADLVAARPIVGAALGDGLVLVCTLLFAVHIVLAGEVAGRFDVLMLTLMQLAVATLLAGAAMVIVEHPTLDQIRVIVPAAAFTGAFATVAAFAVQLQAQRFTSATHAALVFSTEPVFGALFAFLLVGELLAPVALVGCALILAGMLVAQLADVP